MGDVLREAWLWLLLAFIVGVVVGFFLRKYTVRERTTVDTESSSRVATLESDLAAARAELAECRAATSPAPAAVAAATIKPAARKPAARASAASKTAAPKAPAAKKAAPALDLAAGKAALGVTVKLDDLKLIEGIGPKIEGLMKADGITTWAELSKANVERLRAILDAAGPRYNIHDPGTWPKQAGLLAAGKWDEFVALTNALKGGR